MTDVTFELPEESESEYELPAVLPVLPLKETVVFPQSMTPLAIGQERSVRLIDDVVAGDRLLALVTAKDSSVEAPGWDEIYEVGTLAIVHKMIKVPDGTLRILVGGLARIRVAERVSDDPYLVGEFEEVPDENTDRPEVEALMRNVQGQFAPHHRPRAVPARGAAARGGERRRPERARPPGRLDDADDPDRGAPADPRDGRRRAAAAADLGDPEPRARGVRARLEDPVAGPVGDGEGPARVLPAPAAQGDPGRARRGRPRAGRGERAARAARGADPARRRAEGRRSRARAPRAAAPGGGGVRRDPHLPRVDHHLAVGHAHRGQPRPRACAHDARRRPLRPREGQGPDRRAPRGREAPQQGLGTDPLLRRPARRRQDIARAVDRAGARAQVRAHVGGRRPRRVRDPRPPAHVHRRDARHDHPLAPRRRVVEPAAPDRRDRQDGLRLARRPVVGDARGARPGAEQVVPRPLPRPAVRPLEGALHLHREHDRHDPRPAARPHRRDPADGLHRGGEARNREALPAAEAARRRTA